MAERFDEPSVNRRRSYPASLGRRSSDVAPTCVARRRPKPVSLGRISRGPDVCWRFGTRVAMAETAAKGLVISAPGDKLATGGVSKQGCISVFKHTNGTQLSPRDKEPLTTWLVYAGVGDLFALSLQAPRESKQH